MKKFIQKLFNRTLPRRWFYYVYACDLGGLAAATLGVDNCPKSISTPIPTLLHSLTVHYPGRRFNILYAHEISKPDQVWITDYIRSFGNATDSLYGVKIANGLRVD